MSPTEHGDRASQVVQELQCETPVMSPRLLKRLGEAAMGTPREFGEQYWICRYVRDTDTKSYDIKGPFHNRTEAKDAIKGGDGFGIFGPYEPAEDEGSGPLPEPSGRVTTIHVYVEGRADPIEIDQKFDALFWSYSAIEKFVYPYYCGAEGLDYTLKVYQEYTTQRAFLMAHSDDTEYTLWGAVRGAGLVPMLQPLNSSR